jgi:hypothetical protein
MGGYVSGFECLDCKAVFGDREKCPHCGSLNIIWGDHDPDYERGDNDENGNENDNDGDSNSGNDNGV